MKWTGLIVMFLLITGCATVELTDDEKYYRQEAREIRAEIKARCAKADGVWLEDRFKRGSCISREQYHDMMGGWQ